MFSKLGDFTFLFISLDLYTQRLLWKYIKKLHTKRTNIWLCMRYWRFFNGLWRFFTFDSQNKCILLKSHLHFKQQNKHILFSFNVFDYKNRRKLWLDLQFEFELSLSPVLKYVSKYQNGLCFICKKPFLYEKLKILIDFSRLYIKHYDCHV